MLSRLGLQQFGFQMNIIEKIINSYNLWEIFYHYSDILTQIKNLHIINYILIYNSFNILTSITKQVI